MSQTAPAPQQGPPEPTPRGNVILSKTNDCLAKALKRDEAYDGPRYISHWATCPNAPRRSSKSVPSGVRNPSGSE